MQIHTASHHCRKSIPVPSEQLIWSEQLLNSQVKSHPERVAVPLFNSSCSINSSGLSLLLQVTLIADLTTRITELHQPPQHKSPGWLSFFFPAPEHLGNSRAAPNLSRGWVELHGDVVFTQRIGLLDPTSIGYTCSTLLLQ